MRRAFTVHSNKALKHFTSTLRPIPCSDNLKSNTYIIVPPKTLSSSPYTPILRFYSSSSETEPKSEPKSEPIESISEPIESKSEPIESISEPIEPKSEPTESESEPIDSESEPIEAKSEDTLADIGDVSNEEVANEEEQALFNEFEDKLVSQLTEEEKAAQQFDGPDENDDNSPPDEGPILRWQSRVVFAPGIDAWHPKNRKVKMAVTVKELGLSKHQFLRLRDLVGKRYNAGKDELTITSERFDHREENRKDCLRTLYALVDEARKADELVENAHTSYVKERLKENPEFMEKLRAKVLRTRESNREQENPT